MKTVPLNLLCRCSYGCLLSNRPTVFHRRPLGTSMRRPLGAFMALITTAPKPLPTPLVTAPLSLTTPHLVGLGGGAYFSHTPPSGNLIPTFASGVQERTPTAPADLAVKSMWSLDWRTGASKAHASPPYSSSPATITLCGPSAAIVRHPSGWCMSRYAPANLAAAPVAMVRVHTEPSGNTRPFLSGTTFSTPTAPFDFLVKLKATLPPFLGHTKPGIQKISPPFSSAPTRMAEVCPVAMTERHPFGWLGSVKTPSNHRGGS
mmetsp:Transcript_762/g.1607  ORF Transcript_762/g.1607 Transcript_762/m.1607 type:complete len:261 (+) Transcript_762:147-929(+)